MEIPKITIASVKVMRSYDYCHFEVTLGADLDSDPTSPEWFKKVDDIRKHAARLVDKAVAQYKVAKAAQEGEEILSWTKRQVVEMAGSKPEYERTPEEKAAIKALADARFAQRHYDYQDDWDDCDDQDS